MALRTKLANLVIRETSGVDHPAHLHEGWLVIKSAADKVAKNEELTEMDLEVTEDIAEVVEAPMAVESDIRKEMTDLRKELADLRVEKQRIESQRELEKAVETAHSWNAVPTMNPEEFGPVLVSLRKSAPAEAAIIEGLLTAASTALAESGIFKELGSTTNSDGMSAWDKIQSLANDMVANGSASTFAKAVSLVTAEDKGLYNQYINEKGI